MNLPVGVRIAALFVIGCVVGSAVNGAARRLRWEPDRRHPWWDGQAGWRDRIPVVGWWSWSGEGAGNGFGGVQAAIELAMGGVLAGLYWWVVIAGGPLMGGAVGLADPAQLHWEFLSQAVLATLMLAASLLDIDEKIIPDSVTVTGTLVGLAAAAAVPTSLLPWVQFGWVGVPPELAPVEVDFLRLSSPNEWPAALEGFPRWGSLALGLAIYWMWCFALLPRQWRGRRGMGMAWRLFVARIAREPVSVRILGMAIVGSGGIAGVWWWGVGARSAHWEGLLSSLVGAAVAGGLIWAVRLVGAAAMRREAMGFGDVTLMAMVGSFVGWQAGLMIFFVSPLFGLGIGIGQWVLRRETEIPYGPFLCLGTAAVVVFWSACWAWIEPLLRVGWLIPLVMIVCIGLMAVMLLAMQGVLRLFGRG